uniref:Uncharacterized protein n=1 Tax=Oryzias latipes TaxID=8090 RepID=A0A3P9GXE3_ORYLA
MVTVPAVLQAGTKTQFCAVLQEPSEFVIMSVYLKSETGSKSLLRKGTRNSFIKCFSFHVPLVEKCEIQLFEVTVEGQTVYSKEVKKVFIKTFKPKTFIQTDTAIYNPGQTGRYDLMMMIGWMKMPLFFCLYLCFLTDPHNIIIEQWVNQTPRRGILERSFQLSSGASEGYYRIVLKAGKDRFYQSFKVQKFSLPKFDIIVTIPKEISVGQKHFEVEVCAKYKCGKPVGGSAVVTVCRPTSLQVSHEPVFLFTHIKTHKTKYNIATQNDRSLCGKFYFYFFLFFRHYIFPNLIFLSGIAHTKWERINITYSIGRLSFLETPQTYTQGQPLNGKVIVVTVSFSHVVRSAVCFVFSVMLFFCSTRFKLLVTVAHLATKPGEHEKHKSPFFTSATITVSESGPGPTTGGFLRVRTVEKPLRCGETEEITIQYSLESEYSPILEIIFLVNTSEVLQGEFDFPLKVTPDMAPYIQVVAYTVLSCDKFLAHSAEFPTEECFKNEVSGRKPGIPGEKIKLTLKGDPDSLCGVRTIDFRSTIRKPGTLLDAHQVKDIFDLLPIQKPDSIPHELLDFSKCLHVRPKRSISGFTNQEGEYAYTKQGMVILSNLEISNPKCLKLKGKKYFRGLLLKIRRGSGHSRARNDPVLLSLSRTSAFVKPISAVSRSGKRSVHLTVPSVVTSWETDAFCLNSHGFGLAQQKTLLVSPPFTLHLATPKSVFLGESFVLKAAVTNNLQSCIKVKSGISISACLWVKSQILCIRRTVTVTITAAAVDADTFCEGHPVVVPEKGHTSSMTRSIDVKSKFGAERFSVCSKGPVVRAVMDVEMPEVVVPGSLYIKVAVMGDVLNRLVHNLGEPLDFPYENGDWNIASMAINIYVLNYLKETQQLEHSMKEEEAVNFLKKGKFLSDKSGAFSIFESGPRSSWLTALVMVTLYQAQPFIFIDENVINQARKWLECQQRENGCFKVSGKHSTKKKGGCAIDEVAYNAFILAAFLEMGVSPDDPVVKMGLCCLKESIKDLQNPFAAAISAWVFTLAKDMEPRAQLLHYLDTIAIKEETSVFSSLLISSYVILAKLTVTGSPRDLRSASHTFKWLVEHLNYYSTFSSTQDTMVAVKAIALYSKCMYTPTWSSTVSIWSPNDKVVFQLTPHNKLLYQEMVLQDINGKYSVKMEGKACALVQVCVHLSCDKYLFVLLTGQYSGHQLCTNMVVLEIQLPTGFCPLPQSLRSVSLSSRFCLT